MSFLDESVERYGRGLAARTTRRTFLDRMAKLGVLVAGGPTLASLLVERAEARVCGQSGVTGKCPTFDCTGPGDVWGWCWYASPGCCSNGGLKKICDCCTVNFPNVHGYCPSGTNVRCIVESCAADPRVMAVGVIPLGAASGIEASLARARRLPDAMGGTVVVGDAEDVLAASVAAPVAGVADGALLLTGRAGLDGAVRAEIVRLAPVEILVVGPALPPTIDAELQTIAPTIRPSVAPDLSLASLEIARYLQQRAGARRAFCVETTGVSAEAAPAAGAAAAARKVPLLVGVDQAITAATGEDALAVTYLVGPEASARAGQVPGGFPLRTADRDGLALEVSSVAAGSERLRGLTVHVVPGGSADAAVGATAGIVVYHPDGVIGGGLAAWLRIHQPALGRAFTYGGPGALGSGGTYELQSSLNRFDTHVLQGVSGQGLPVISQPLGERELGRAREKGAPPADRSSYWAGRARTGG